MFTLSVIACFGLGWYAGKKRSEGLGWGEIAKDFYNDAMNVSTKACGLFKKN